VHPNPAPVSLFSGYLKSGVKRKVALREQKGAAAHFSEPAMTRGSFL